jgi:hypothetical protein
MNFNLNSQTSEASHEAPKTPGPVQAKPPVKLNFNFGSQAPPSFGTTTPQEALKPSSPIQKQKAPISFGFTTGSQAHPSFGSTTPKTAPKTSSPMQQQKAPAVQQPTKCTPQLLDFNAMTWCATPDDELKELTWSRFSFSGEQQARLLIWGLAMRFKDATVVLLLQADLAKTGKKHSSITPLCNEIFTFVKGAAAMTKACRGGVAFHSGDGWYDSARLFNDEIIAESPVWELLKSKYDRKTIKDLQKVWLENEPHWAGPVA